MAESQAAPAATSDALAASQDVVSRIDALLAAEKAPPAKAKAAPTGEAPQSTEQTEQAPAEEEVPAGPNKTTEGEDAPEKEAPAQEKAEIPLDQLEAIELEVTTKGEDGADVTAKHSIKELKLGYMRQADYSKKTAEVARQRSEVAEKTRQAIEGERSQYQAALKQMQQLVMETAASELKDVNWDHLAANDAFEYVRLRNRADKFAQALSSIQAKEKEVSDKRTAEQAEAVKKAATTARAQLEADIPGFNDAMYQSLMKAGEKFGFKAEEIGTWVDPRAIKLLHAATQAQAGAPVKPSADKKVVVVPKTVKPGASADETRGQQRHAEAMKKLQGSGTIQDAAAVLRARIPGL